MKINPRDVKEITLLSIEEAEQVPQELRVLKVDGVPHWWWLRSPAFFWEAAASVSPDGSIREGGNYVDCDFDYVRPALRVSIPESSGLKDLDKVEVFGHTWTVITNDLILCDDSLGQMVFRKDAEESYANYYEESDVKRWLEGWLQEQLTIAEQRELPDRVVVM